MAATRSGFQLSSNGLPAVVPQQSDVPIAFLNLDHGAEEALESWHWVTITSISRTKDGQAAQVSICDEGVPKQINLKLWLETTIQGGGFVYFLPDSHTLVKYHGK